MDTKMHPSLKLILPLIFLVITAHSASVCPSGTLSYDAFSLLADEALKYKSQNSDVFYRMTEDEGVFKLN